MKSVSGDSTKHVGEQITQCAVMDNKKSLHQTGIEPVSLALKASVMPTTGIGPMLLTFKASMPHPLRHQGCTISVQDLPYGEEVG